MNRKIKKFWSLTVKTMNRNCEKITEIKKFLFNGNIVGYFSKLKGHPPTHNYSPQATWQK